MRADGRNAGDAVQERGVAPDRLTLLTCAAVLVVAAAAWVSVISSAADSGSMDEGMAGGPTAVGALAFVAAWTVMMAAMMLPSALPMISLYGAVQRNAQGSTQSGAPVALFALVYLGLWAAAGLPAYAAGVLLGAVSPELLPYGVAAALLVAGAYQLSPLKQVCLRACRSPLGFLMGHWRAGFRGGLAMARAHAAYCLGCCWALMAVLVVAGAMGLPWVLLIAVIVAAEKLLPQGEWTARIAGFALVLVGVAVAAQPGVAMVLRGGTMQ
jgi:predicted metal-binding membrane protein